MLVHTNSTSSTAFGAGEIRLPWFQRVLYVLPLTYNKIKADFI
jgi:hypothetical protein